MNQYKHIFFIIVFACISQTGSATEKLNSQASSTQTETTQTQVSQTQMSSESFFIINSVSTIIAGLTGLTFGHHVGSKNTNVQESYEYKTIVKCNNTTCLKDILSKKQNPPASSSTIKGQKSVALTILTVGLLGGYLYYGKDFRHAIEDIVSSEKIETMKADLSILAKTTKEKFNSLWPKQ